MMRLDLNGDRALTKDEFINGCLQDDFLRNLLAPNAWTNTIIAQSKCLIINEKKSHKTPIGDLSVSIDGRKKSELQVIHCAESLWCTQISMAKDYPSWDCQYDIFDSTNTSDLIVGECFHHWIKKNWDWVIHSWRNRRWNEKHIEGFVDRGEKSFAWAEDQRDFDRVLTIWNIHPENVFFLGLTFPFNRIWRQ